MNKYMIIILSIVAIVIIAVGVIAYSGVLRDGQKITSISEKFSYGYFLLTDPNGYWTMKYPEAIKAIQTKLVDKGEDPKTFYVSLDQENTSKMNINALQFDLVSISAASNHFNASTKNPIMIAIYNQDTKRVLLGTTTDPGGRKYPPLPDGYQF